MINSEFIPTPSSFPIRLCSKRQASCNICSLKTFFLYSDFHNHAVSVLEILIWLFPCLDSLPAFYMTLSKHLLTSIKTMVLLMKIQKLLYLVLYGSVSSWCLSKHISSINFIKAFLVSCYMKPMLDLQLADKRGKNPAKENKTNVGMAPGTVI